MNEIRQNESLMDRIRKGSKDQRKKEVILFKYKIFETEQSCFSNVGEKNVQF